MGAEKNKEATNNCRLIRRKKRKAMARLTILFVE
jgi:hypothetical protein